ncbi:MAG: FixH family protein, partial [Pseudomonadota bacterium]
AKLVRPSDSTLDRLVVLELGASGHYATRLEPLRSGLWEVRAQMDHGEARFFVTERIILP